MQSWGLTDVGCVRKQNQDAFHIEKLDRHSLLCVVCDGMGGESEGGFNLTSSGGGTFCIVGLNDRHSYYEAGNVTIAVDQECVLIDDADLDNPGKTLYAGDLLSLEDDAYGYTPDNTTVTVAGGKIIEIHRVYTP